MPVSWGSTQKGDSGLTCLCQARLGIRPVIYDREYSHKRVSQIAFGSGFRHDWVDMRACTRRSCLSSIRR
jgi:hypothetical protein